MSRLETKMGRWLFFPYLVLRGVHRRSVPARLRVLRAARAAATSAHLLLQQRHVVAEARHVLVQHPDESVQPRLARAPPDRKPALLQRAGHAARQRVREARRAVR